MSCSNTSYLNRKLVSLTYSLMAMRIERENNEIRFSIPDNIIDIDEIQNFIDYVRFKEISIKSKASESDASDLADEINSSWWKKNKYRFE